MKLRLHPAFATEASENKLMFVSIGGGKTLDSLFGGSLVTSFVRCFFESSNSAKIGAGWKRRSESDLEDKNRLHCVCNSIFSSLQTQCSI